MAAGCSGRRALAAFLADNHGVPSPSGTADVAPLGRRAPRAVLADDDVLLREGLASLLDRSGFDVIGQAGNSTELLALTRSAQPELAIIDIRMPPGYATEGLEAARVIRAELPGTAIIVLSAHVEVDEAMDLLAGGERTGYLLKSRVTDVAEFIDTVGRITAGASVVDPSLVCAAGRARPSMRLPSSSRCSRSRWPVPPHAVPGRPPPRSLRPRRPGQSRRPTGTRTTLLAAVSHDLRTPRR